MWIICAVTGAWTIIISHQNAKYTLGLTHKIDTVQFTHTALREPFPLFCVFPNIAQSVVTMVRKQNKMVDPYPCLIYTSKNKHSYYQLLKTIIVQKWENKYDNVNLLPLNTIFWFLFYEPNSFQYIGYVVYSSLLSYCKLVSCLCMQEK